MRVCKSLKSPAPKLPNCTLPLEEAVVAVVTLTTPALVSSVEPKGIWRASVSGMNEVPLVSAAYASRGGAEAGNVEGENEARVAPGGSSM